MAERLVGHRRLCLAKCRPSMPGTARLARLFQLERISRRSVIVRHALDAAERGPSVLTPRIGERVDLSAPAATMGGTVAK